jgi:ribonuclease R
LQEKVLSTFRANPTLAMNYKQVSRQLNITQTSKKKIIAKVLFELEAKEALVEEKPGKFKLINHESNLNKLVGKVDMTTSGSGYVEVEGLPNDIYIGEKDLGNSLAW